MTTQFLGDSRFVGAGRLRLGILLLPLVLGFLGTLVLLLILRPATVVSAPEEGNKLASLGSATSVSAATSSIPTIRITKTVTPTYIDTGGTVSICFTIRRPGLDVALMQDVSGSMAQEDVPTEGGGCQTRLEASQVAARALVDELQDTDRAAVVPCSTTVHLGQVQPLTTTKGSVLQIIDGLTAEGWTNFGEGISVSHRELLTSPRYLSDTVKVIMLLSDGRANCHEDGCSEEEGVAAEAARYAREKAEYAANDNIRIHTIGFGRDANEGLLQDIAAIGGGEYFSTPDTSVLETIYLTVALGLHNLVITDILTPGVETDCSRWPNDLCVEGPSGATTLTFPISTSSLISNSMSRCFTATVNLEPGYVGPTNDPSSGFCYQDSRGHRFCYEFDNPVITVCRLKTVFLPVVTRDYPPPIVVNGGFESVWTGWAYGGELSQTITTTNPHSGNNSALLGDPNYECKHNVPKGSAWMEQTVLLPSRYPVALSFWYNILTYDKDPRLSGRFDSFDIKINGVRVFRDMNTTNPYQCNNLRDLGWQTATINLSDYIGAYVTIRFEDWHRFDNKYPTWTYVDDVKIAP